MKVDPTSAEAEKAAQASGAAFRRRAEEARSIAAQARESAENAGAKALPLFADATALEGQGQQALQAGQLVGATRRFLESRIRFERAERAARRPSRHPAGPAGSRERAMVRFRPRAAASTHEPRPIGKYRVVAKIGEGAMGEVYKAHDPLLNRFVALKTISQGLASDPQFKERFIREAQSAAGLNHPNIITVYDFGEEAGLTFMAMEFLEGVDLREAIRAKTLGHLGRKIEVMEQLCEGVGFAHSRGVIHRDLKPGNIHIQPSGHVKVLDFGLARLGASDMTKTGTVMGTPHYMSPEQLKGQKADARSDVFSLGAIFYELLSGARAFEGQAMHEVLQRMRDRDPVPVRRRAPSHSRGARGHRRPRHGPRTRGSLQGRGRDGPRRSSTPATSWRARRSRPRAPARTRPSARCSRPPARRSSSRGRERPSVAGTSALDVGRHHHETSRTVRPDATVASGPRTEVGSATARSIAGAVVLAVAAVAGGVWLARSADARRSGRRPRPARRTSSA